ncbi:serine/threonine-protein kinase [Micromonospora lupini]|uniref:non-specific serine/threonine protein kinase n=1 Tax=Micromonospora lupini str. Lupac 08 TaxID=1150864 RepID=I0LD35_9ACTN|nr:serine/threonine-protein kinase [Micromonospora lupini]CCH21732.1 Two-component serine/threonine protein kinase [Micromonospora lupini str. Lupac 08]
MQRDRLLAGRYRLLERLGSGGMSAVHRAYDEVLERDVAVKVLVASDANARQRIRAEAKVAARLSHPHVTSVYDFGESVVDGVQVPFVVLELLNGVTLEQRLAAGPLPPRAGLRVCAEVAAALEAAHAQGLVHRDVKPSNVMLTPTGAKVLDFGIAAVVGDSEIDFDGRLLGTPAYLAPERLAAGEVLPACDVYALGLLLHRTLTGRLPWAAETQTGMLRAHVHVEPDPLPEIDGVPAEIHRLYRWCLARDPADRPPAAEAARILFAAAGPAVAGAATAPPAAGAAADPVGAGAGAPDKAGEPLPDASAAAPEVGQQVAAVPHRPPPSKAAEPGTGVTVDPTDTLRRRSRRRHRAVLAVGGAVIAAVAVAGSLGDYATRQHDGTHPRTGIGTGGTTTVGLPETVAQPEPSVDQPPAGPSTRTTPAAPRTSPSAGTGGRSTPASTRPAPRPTPTPTEPQVLTVQALGGTVTVRCLGGSAELLTVTPAPGYRAAPYDPGPAKQVQVELASAEHSSEIRTHCAGGRPKPNVKERGN